ncbi:MAG: hypothetical protein JSR46_05375, partial [Verrucomicrobia bacterium]|nr:hypothetical protein [Verrucomicrobiota bacterium]
MAFNVHNNLGIWGQLPDDVVGEILYQVDSSCAPQGDERLKELKCVSKSFKYIIENQYPQCKARIDLARRVEQFFMTFNDRPIWERVGLV